MGIAFSSLYLKIKSNELSLGCLSNALKYKAVQIITVY